MPLRHRAAGTRQRSIKPRNFCRRAIGMAGDVTGLADLEFCFGEVSRHREFGEMKALGLQQLPRRTLVEQARNDDVGIYEQHVLGAAGQNRIAGDVTRRLGLPAIAREPAQTQNLLGVSQRQQQLVGADIHRHHARQIGRQCGAMRERKRQHRERNCQPPSHQISAQGTITASR